MFRAGVVALSLAALLVVPAASCRPPAGSINHQGFRHTEYSYRVAPKDVSAAGTNLMGSDWLLDNYFVKKGRFVEKRTNEYMERLAVDGDNDGKWEFNKDVPIYDLRFLHRNRDAAIWLRTFPLSGREKDRELAVLMQNAVESVAGAGYERVRVHPRTVIVEEKRFAAVPVRSGMGRIAGTDALFAHVDVANLDQLRVQPGAYSTRVELVILKPPLTHRVYREDGSKLDLPVLMVAGYKNSPNAFEQDLPAFRDFLDRLEVGDQRGLSVPRFAAVAATPAPAAAPSPAAATPAPATPPAPPAASPPPPAPNPATTVDPPPPSAPPVAPAPAASSAPKASATP